MQFGHVQYFLLNVVFKSELIQVDSKYIYVKYYRKEHLRRPASTKSDSTDITIFPSNWYFLKK